MVRIYCLSKISKLDPSDNPINISPYNSDELREIGNFVLGESNKIDSDNPVQTKYYRLKEKIEDKNDSKFRLTEISVGFLYVKKLNIGNHINGDINAKGYAMKIYRKDTGILSFVLKRGSVILKPVSTYNFDLIINTSRIFDNSDDHDFQTLDFDILINVRCIKNTVIKGIIHPSEEKYYEEYADKLVNSPIDDNVPSFEDFKLPNETKLNVIRTKISDFKALIHLLCDPETGSFKIVPMSNRYNQELKCLLYTRKLWRTKNFRKEEFETQINNYIGCETLRWEKVNFEKLTADIKNVGSMKEIDFDACRIMNYKNEIYPNFKTLNFTCLTTLNLQSCGLKEFSDEFAEILFPCLEKLNLEHNDLNLITNKIAKFKSLKSLWIGNNRNLSDDGIPWKYLPESIDHLSLSKTNISEIPAEINRLKDLCIFSTEGKNLQYISWKDIGSKVKYFHVYKAKSLNSIEFKNASSLFEIALKNANLTTIDCENLPHITSSLTLEKNRLENFDTKTALSYLVELKLSQNKLKTICWETLPVTLRDLELNNNELEVIGDISHLEGLHRLSMNSNKVSTLSINVRNIQTIYLNSNQIENIPPEISNLRQLGTLQLSKNKISKLPDNFQTLPLHTLNLSNNEFKYFDSTHSESLLGRLWTKLPAKIFYLNLDGNELHELPCILQNYAIADLCVNGCKSTHICPCIF